MKEINNESVRRQDRLLDMESAERLLKNGEYGVLSMVESCGGYGVPINFAWDGGEYIYFHCAPEGYKLECIDVNANVSFCIVGRTDVISHKFTTAYESVIVRGRINRGLPEEDRMHALSLILDKYSPKEKEIGMKYAEKSFHRTEILRLAITSISAKGKEVHR